MIRFLLVGMIVSAKNYHATPASWLEEAIVPSRSSGNVKFSSSIQKHAEESSLAKSVQGDQNDKARLPTDSPPHSVSHPMPQRVGETALNGSKPWEDDRVRLEERLRQVQLLHKDEEEEEEEEGGNTNPAPPRHRSWPLGTTDFDRARGVDHSLFAQDPRERCALLSRPPPPPHARRGRKHCGDGRGQQQARQVLPSPIAVLLVGQLRTAEVTIPFMAVNIIRASAPTPIHVFAHVWSLLSPASTTTSRKGTTAGEANNSGPTPPPFSSSAPAPPPPPKARTASERALLRLRRMPELKALAVDAEESFVTTVCAFYDARYGEGWCWKRVSATSTRASRRRGEEASVPSFWFTPMGTFLSQWYTLSAGHGLLRRWYRDHAITSAAGGCEGGGRGGAKSADWEEENDGKEFSDELWNVNNQRGKPFGSPEPRFTPPPQVILRLRLDHLVSTSWNLTSAAAEFMGRAAAQKAGSNFLALWGPSSHSEYCNGDLCPDQVGKTTKDGAGCYSNGRLDDAFAFGTPPAMDVYAAPYHPYATEFAEDYVTMTLPLGNIVEVGAHESAGGVFGSLGMPGSCGHRSGHYPMTSRPLVGEKGSKRGAFLEYLTDVGVPYGPVRRGKLRTPPRAYRGLSDAEILGKEQHAASEIAKSSVLTGPDQWTRYSLPVVPGPFAKHSYYAGQAESEALTNGSQGAAGAASMEDRRNGKAEARAMASLSAAYASALSAGVRLVTGNEVRDTGLPSSGSLPSSPLSSRPPFSSPLSRDGSAGDYETSHFNVRTVPRFDVQGRGETNHINRNGLMFNHLCAPLFYFNKFGVSILRFRDVVGVAQKQAELLQTEGSCPPLLERDPKPTDKKSPMATNKSPERNSKTCSDVRRGRAASVFPWVKNQLLSNRQFCSCSDPVTLNFTLPEDGKRDFFVTNKKGADAAQSNLLGKGNSPDVLPYDFGLKSLMKSFEDHCAQAALIEFRACKNGRGTAARAIGGGKSARRNSHRRAPRGREE